MKPISAPFGVSRYNWTRSTCLYGQQLALPEIGPHYPTGRRIFIFIYLDVLLWGDGGT